MATPGEVARSSFCNDLDCQNALTARIEGKSDFSALSNRPRGSARPPERPRYVLILQPQPHVDPIRALKKALKILLRACGMRCLSVERVDGGAP